MEPRNDRADASPAARLEAHLAQAGRPDHRDDPSDARRQQGRQRAHRDRSRRQADRCGRVILRRVALAAFACALAVGQPARAAEPDTSCEPKDLAALKGWEGVWGAEGMEGDIAGSVRAAPKFFGLFAPWNDTGWQRMRQLGVLNRANPLRIAAAWGFP